MGIRFCPVFVIAAMAVCHDAAFAQGAFPLGTPAPAPVPVQTPAVAAPQPQPSTSPEKTSILGSIQHFFQSTNSAQAAQLVQDYHSALTMVEGNKGVGSGFLCTMGGHTYAMTNAHVLCDNVGVKITSLDDVQIATGPGGIAVGRDIVRIEVAAAPKTFEVMENVDSTAKIGDAVVVLGNAEGAHVVHPVEGKIVGIGPDLIEVSAPFVPGNSGSPIIHLATGKVIGIATYMIVRKVQVAGAAVAVSARRFGYRMDNVKQWETINWPFFFAQAAQVAAITQQSEDFVALLTDINKAMAAASRGYVPQGPALNEGNYKTQGIQRAVRDLNEAAATHQGRVALSSEDQKRTMDRFYSALRATARDDIAQFNARPAYDYFRRKVDEQTQFRSDLVDAFTKAMEQVSTQH